MIRAGTLLRLALTLALHGCGGGAAAVGEIAAYSGGLGVAVVEGKHQGDGVMTLAGAGYAGATDRPDGTPYRTGGLSVQSSGVGIASDGLPALAVRSRLELGGFGDDYIFGEIDTEIGVGVLAGSNVGGAFTTGWRYSGFFDGKHAIPLRAMGYVALPRVVVHGSLHRAYRDDTWDAYGADLNVVVLRRTGVTGLSLGLRYEHEDNADIVGLSVGWALHAHGDGHD